MESKHADTKLVDRLLQGDERAFEAFFNGYFPRLFRFALLRLDHNEDRAEEVVQAALCKAVTKLATYRGEAALFTWLCTFCRHEISALLQRENRMSATTEVNEDDPSVRAALESLSLATAYDPDAALSRSEVARMVQVTLDHLPSLYSDALEWKYIHGLSVKEISERIGRGPKAVESILTRARVAFRDGFTSLVAEGAPYPEEMSPAGH